MNMNTKSNRKKLARALFNVHRSRLDLLPFYSRLAATLYSCVPDVAEHLSLMLLRDFRFHVSLLLVSETSACHLDIQCDGCCYPALLLWLG